VWHPLQSPTSPVRICTQLRLKNRTLLLSLLNTNQILCIPLNPHPLSSACGTGAYMSRPATSSGRTHACGCHHVFVLRFSTHVFRLQYFRRQKRLCVSGLFAPILPPCYPSSSSSTSYSCICVFVYACFQTPFALQACTSDRCRYPPSSGSAFARG
jgi:hypothetical protein